MDHSHHDHDHSIHAHHNTMGNITSSIATTIASVIEHHMPDLIHNADNDQLLNSSATTMASNITTTVSAMINHAAHDHIHEGHDNMDGMDHMDMGGMPMYFQFALKATILFKEWNVTTAGGMVGSVIGVMILAILYEGLKFLREYLFRNNYSRLSYSTCAVTGVENNCGDSRGVELHKVTENKMLGFPHALQTALHVVQIILSYCLMLIFMTFNLWLCLGVVLGSAIGYFFFGWRRSTVVDVSDHCH